MTEAARIKRSTVFVFCLWCLFVFAAYAKSIPQTDVGRTLIQIVKSHAAGVFSK